MKPWSTLPLAKRVVNLDRRRVPVAGKDRREGPYPYYGASGVVDFVDGFIFDGLHLLVAEDGENLRSRKTPVAFLADGKFWVNNHAHVLQANAENDIRFLAYALEASDISPYLTGSTQPKLSQSGLNQIPITAPELEEQKAIADTLAALDDAADSNIRTATKAEELLDGLSVWAGSDVSTCPLGSIAQLGKAIVKPSSLGDAGVDHFSLPAFDLGARPERVAASTVMSNKQRLDVPSVLVSRLNPRTNRTWWAIPREDAVAIASTEFAVLLPREGVAMSGLWLAVRDESFRLEIVRRVTGTSGSHQRVRPDDLLTIEVPNFGDIDEEVAETAADLLALVETKRAEAAILRELRDTLLPELLSGRIRVPVEGVAG